LRKELDTKNHESKAKGELKDAERKEGERKARALEPETRGLIMGGVQKEAPTTVKVL